MSFISGFLTKDFCSIVADGRMSQGAKTVGENYKKFMLAESNILIATTGNAQVADIIKDFIKRLHVQSNGAQLNWQLYVNVIQQFVKETLKGAKDIDGNCVNQIVVICGVNGNKIMALAFGQTDAGYIQREYLPEENEQKFFTMTPPGVNPDAVTKEFISITNKIGIRTYSDIVIAQSKLQDYVAEIDSGKSVNTHKMGMGARIDGINGRFKEWSSGN